MISRWNLVAIAALVSVAQPAIAVTRVGVDLGQVVGRVVGDQLPLALGSALPAGMGGVAGIAALSLVIGVQLVKRRRK